MIKCYLDELRFSRVNVNFKNTSFSPVVVKTVWLALSFVAECSGVTSAPRVK
jgi:hypothetical protein